MLRNPLDCRAMPHHRGHGRLAGGIHLRSKPANNIFNTVVVLGPFSQSTQPRGSFMSAAKLHPSVLFAIFLALCPALFFLAASGRANPALAANLIDDPSFEIPKERDQFGLVFAKWGGWKYEGDCEFARRPGGPLGPAFLPASRRAGAKIRVRQRTTSSRADTRSPPSFAVSKSASASGTRPPSSCSTTNTCSSARTAPSVGPG